MGDEVVERAERAIDLLQVRQRAREAALPVPEPVALSPEEAADVDRLVERGRVACLALKAKALQRRAHALWRARGGPGAERPAAAPVVPLSLVDESGVERQRALPAAPRPVPRPRDTRSSVQLMLDRGRSVQERIGGRFPREGRAK